jgi:hypothetical protein
MVCVWHRFVVCVSGWGECGLELWVKMGEWMGACESTLPQTRTNTCMRAPPHTRPRYCCCCRSSCCCWGRARRPTPPRRRRSPAFLCVVSMYVRLGQLVNQIDRYMYIYVCIYMCVYIYADTETPPLSLVPFHTYTNLYTHEEKSIRHLPPPPPPPRPAPPRTPRRRRPSQPPWWHLCCILIVYAVFVWVLIQIQVHVCVQFNAPPNRCIHARV